MLVAKDESGTVLTATEMGYGKRTPVAEYTRHGRGGQGMIAIQASERNGRLVGATLVDDHDEVMLISTGGVLIRTEVAQIRPQGRSTQGVTLISLDDGQLLAGIERIVERDAENGADGDGGEGESALEGNGGDNGNGSGNGNGNGNGSGDGGEEPPLVPPTPGEPSGLH